jgi:hypothetical protein
MNIFKENPDIVNVPDNSGDCEIEVECGGCGSLVYRFVKIDYLIKLVDNYRAAKTNAASQGVDAVTKVGGTNVPKGN